MNNRPKPLYMFLSKRLIPMKLISTSLLLICIVLCGCEATRDDTTGAMRQLISTQMGIPYEQVKPEASLKDLNFDDLDAIELILEIEDAFSITITDEEIDSLGEKGNWFSITVLDLADLVRDKHPKNE